MPYIKDGTGTEPGSPIIPVVALEFIDLDALAVVGRRRGRRHNATAAGAVAAVPGDWLAK